MNMNYRHTRQEIIAKLKRLKERPDLLGKYGNPSDLQVFIDELLEYIEARKEKEVANEAA